MTNKLDNVIEGLHREILDYYNNENYYQYLGVFDDWIDDIQYTIIIEDDKVLISITDYTEDYTDEEIDNGYNLRSNYFTITEDYKDYETLKRQFYNALYYAQ